MGKNFDLRQKKVIDAETAEKIGYIREMDIDFEKGIINSVTIPGGGIFGLFGGKRTVKVAWEDIIAIGSEYILIKRHKDAE